MKKLFGMNRAIVFWVLVLVGWTGVARGQITLGRGEQSTDLIAGIAEGLNNEPLAIYNWVLTKVEYQPYYGLRQGAHVTALEGRGNDYDQCVLLVSLLKHAGVPDANIHYLQSNVAYSTTDIDDWLHWEITTAYDALGGLAIPRSTVSGGSITVARVMVQVVIGGNTYILDPAYKRSTRSVPQSVTGALPYTYFPSSITAAAAAYAPSDDEVSGPDVDAFNAALNAVERDYVRTLATYLHGRDARSILGIPVLSEPDATSLPTALGRSSTLVATWSEIPESRAAKIRFEIGATSSPTFLWCDLTEDIFNLAFDGGGRASLYRGGDWVVTESGTISVSLPVTTFMQYPKYSDGDPDVEYPISAAPVSRSGRSVLLPSFGGSSGRMKHMAALQAEERSASPSSDGALIHTLALLGLQRAVLTDNSLSVAGAMTDRLTFDGGSIWLYHERSGAYSVDGPGQLIYMVKIRPSSLATSQVFDVCAAWTSASEHLSLEQMSSSAAKSSAAVVESALRSGHKILRLTSSNWSSQMALVASGESGVLPGVKTRVVTDGKRAFIPDNLSISIYGGGGLTGGAAIISKYNSGDSWWSPNAWLIDGQLAGGGIGASDQVNNAAVQTGKVAEKIVTPGADPIDLNTGAFLYEESGLKIGDGGEPSGLDFRHFYSSARRLQDTAGVGPGWTHSYDLVASLRHAADVNIRTASVAEVAPLMVATQYLLDILTADRSAKEFALQVLTVNWAARQFLNSKATVALGERRIEFHRLADGTYIQPSSVPATFEQLGDGSYRLSFRHGNTLSFRAADGRATSIVDQHANSLVMSYSGSLLSQVADAYGRSLTFYYSGSTLSSVADSTGRSVSYYRGTDFRITDPDGGTTIFEGGGQITRVIDARGRVIIENDFDSEHRVIDQRPLGDGGAMGEPGINRTTFLNYMPGVTLETDAYGNKWWSTFDARGRRTAYRDPNQNKTTWVYDGADRLVGIMTPRGDITSYEYDTNHFMTKETDPLLHVRNITPDADSRPWKVQNFEGQETVFTYTTAHDVATITAPGGIVTSFTYDSRGRLDTLHPAAYASGQVDTYSYDSYGQIDKITHPGGGYDDYSYSARGDLLEVIDRKGARTTYGYNNRRLGTSVTQWDGGTGYTSQVYYDAVGDVDYTLDASGRKIDLEHDALGQLRTEQRGPTGSPVTTLTRTYDPNKMLVAKTTDALGHDTLFDWDGAHRLIGTTDALGRHATIGYDTDGHATSTTTPLGFVQTTAYDDRGFKDGTTDAESQTVDYTYDKDGRMTVLANRLNRSFTWAYDDANRKVTLKTPALPSLSAISIRNTRGLPDSTQEPSTQTTTFDSYDNEGRLTQKTDGVGTTTYTYWANGLPKEVSENSKTTYRGYDALNRLNEYRDGEGNTLYYSYYPSGELHEITYPDSRKVTYAYDDFGRLHTVTDWASRVTTYGYDNASRLTQIWRPNGTIRVQQYDAANQLLYIKEFKSTGELIFWNHLQYDADGRITSSFLHPKPAGFTLPHDTLAYDNDNQLATWNSTTVTHDADGNMTSGPLPGGTMGTYTYDTRNRLTSAGGSSYRYNPDGLRVETSSTGAATYVVDPSAALSRVLQRTKDGETTYYVYGLGLLYEDTAGTMRYYHADQVGSTLALTDASQTVTDRVEYAPFGPVTTRTGTTDTPFLFNGTCGVMLEPSGLLYMRQRYYNPRVGRFLNADPIGFGGGLNHYAFVGNNPISFVDPMGLERQSNGDIVTLERYIVSASRMRTPVGGYYDPFGQSHMSFCMACHDGTSAGDLYKQQAVLANALDWRVIAYEQLLGAALSGGVGVISEGIAARNEARMLLQANSLRGIATEERVLARFGFRKNFSSVSTAEGEAIPDALTETLSVEVKDRAVVSRTSQIRIATDAAKAAGQDTMLFTGTQTKVTAPAQNRYDVIIRLLELGPGK